ncbi:MAG: transketolase [Chlamydiota bacterium]
MLSKELTTTLTKTANTIRQLTIDATEKAKSGHPGLPLGCAELGAYLYGHLLRHNPRNATWVNRDRFLLSAGHGSMLLYSCLHLAGFNVSLEEIKNFRQLHFHTPGHPESLETNGVETTAGPLGQGFANGVGQALGCKILAERFNTADHTIFDNKVYALISDGEIMEGINHEAAALAGHWQLDNLVAIYDSNNICLDGPTEEVLSDDVRQRYRAYGWKVYEIDGHSLADIHSTFLDIAESQSRPCLIIANTTIGKGSPHKAGTHQAHGSPLGTEEAEATKESLGLSSEPFHIPQTVINFFASKAAEGQKRQERWQKLFLDWQNANPALAAEFHAMENHHLPEDLEDQLNNLEIKTPLASRKASQQVLGFLGKTLPQLYGGSADLSSSDMTMMKEFGIITPPTFEGRNIKYGVREFGMAAITTGLSQTALITPFCGTFLVFSDYMRNAVRLAALQRARVVYQFTHDSIFLGEDGPTHQPVEQLASLRAMPNLQVIRPADNHEVKMAWIAALQYQGPSAIILSRQGLTQLKGTKRPYNEGVGRGGYITKAEKKAKIDYTLFATGSELYLATLVATELEKLDKSVRVVSMPCWEIFEKQDYQYQESIIGGDIGKRVSIEAASDIGWHKYIGRDGIAISVEGFGASAPASELAVEYGFTVESIMERIL